MSGTEFPPCEAINVLLKAKGREYIVSQDNGRRGNYGLRIGNWKLQRHDSKKMYNDWGHFNYVGARRFAEHLRQDLEKEIYLSKFKKP